jgi:hypothetical protein
MPKKPPKLKHLQPFAQEEKEVEKEEEEEEEEKGKEEEEGGREVERGEKEEQVHLSAKTQTPTQTQTHESQTHTHALALDLLIASLCAYAKCTSVFTLQDSRNRHNKKAARLNTSRWNKFIALIRKCLGALGCEEGASGVKGGGGGGHTRGADRDWWLFSAAHLRRGVAFVPLATASIGVGDDAGGGEKGVRGFPDGGGRGRVGGRRGGGNGGGGGGGGGEGCTEDWERFGCACLVAGLLSERGVGSGGVGVEEVEEVDGVVACFLLAFAGGGGEGGAKVHFLERTFYRDSTENTFYREHIL